MTMKFILLLGVVLFSSLISANAIIAGIPAGMFSIGNSKIHIYLLLSVFQE